MVLGVENQGKTRKMNHHQSAIEPFLAQNGPSRQTLYCNPSGVALPEQVESIPSGALKRLSARLDGIHEGLFWVTAPKKNSVFYIVIYYVKYTVKRVKNGGTPNSGPVQNLHRIGRANGAQKWAKRGPSVPHVISGVQMDHFGLVPSAPCVGIYSASWDP